MPRAIVFHVRRQWENYQRRLKAQLMARDFARDMLRVVSIFMVITIHTTAAFLERGISGLGCRVSQYCLQLAG
jgi:hypothetical protein